MSLATNQDKIVRQSVMGRVHHPVLTPQKVYRVGSDGGARFTPAHGAITYDIEIGDSCMGLVGDHIEPGVSSKNADDIENRAYTHLACIGNVAEVVTGKAAGDTGFVTGTHGGIEHVMVWFSQETLNKMVCDDKIPVKSHGQGLALLDYPQVKLMSVDPTLFAKLRIREENGKLVVPVSAVIPAYLMGSGLGAMEIFGSDYDIMTRDPASYEEFHLGDLRFGDLVFIQDHQCFHGPDYLRGSGTVGVIIHGDSHLSGHGPGVTPIMTCRESILVPELDRGANIAFYLGTKKAQ